jgi:hypothetical protein
MVTPLNTKNFSLSKITNLKLKKKFADLCYDINPENMHSCLINKIKSCNIPKLLKADLICNTPIIFESGKVKENYKKGIIASYNDYDFGYSDELDTQQIECYLFNQAVNYCNFFNIKVDYFQILNYYVDRIANRPEILNYLDCLFIKGRNYITFDENSGISFEISEEFKEGVIWSGSKYKNMFIFLKLMCDLHFCGFCDSLISVKLQKLSNNKCLLILSTDSESG